MRGDEVRRVRMIGDIVQKALDMGHNCERMILLLYIYASTCAGEKAKIITQWCWFMGTSG